MIKEFKDNIQNELLTKDFCQVNYVDVLESPEQHIHLNDMNRDEVEFLAKLNFKSVINDFVCSVDNIILSKIAAIKPTCKWCISRPLGIDKKEHYNTFSTALLSQARDAYSKTKRMPHALLVSDTIFPMLYFLNDFEGLPILNICACAEVGTLHLKENCNLKVYVVPQFSDDEYALVISSSDDCVNPYAVQYNIVEDTSDRLKITINYNVQDIPSDLIIKGKIIQEGD